MNRVTINLDALRHNLGVIGDMMAQQQASWSVVTKALCGHEDTLSALHFLGARSVADSRLDNLEAVDRAAPELEKWYLRLPHLSAVSDVVRLADVSLNSEIEIIEALALEAQRYDKQHQIIIMIELGDLREGILPGTLVPFYEKVFNIPHIQVLGLGAQVGCMAGAVPNIDQVSQLLLYRELLELKFDRKLPVISAGSSNFLPLVSENKIPRGVNHFRIGEALFLGTDLINGGTMAGLRDDVIILEAEIVEIKEKALTPTGEFGATTPFENTLASTEANAPGERGFRAVIPIGQLDTDVNGLEPLNPHYHIAGASSDLTVINMGDQQAGLRLGDSIQFKPNYSAFVRMMNNKYVRKEVIPPLSEFKSNLPEKWKTKVAPTVEPTDPLATEGTNHHDRHQN